MVRLACEAISAQEAMPNRKPGATEIAREVGFSIAREAILPAHVIAGYTNKSPKKP
jgi:hypothetical protein